MAVKFEAALDPQSLRRFLVEARAAARMQHPNIVTLYRVGHLDNRPYLVTEYIAGTGLDALPKPLPWQRAHRFALGLVRGLAAAGA